MKKTIEISASFTGKISTGPFENMSPFYSLKEIIEFQDEEVEYLYGWDDKAVQNRQRELHNYCYRQFQQHAEASLAERIAKEYSFIRFYDVGDKKFPSVTSILSWDMDYHMADDHMAQYAARGTIVHKQVEIFLITGEWKDPKDIPEIYPELVILKKGDLNLSLEGYDFPAFYKEYPFQILDQEKVVINYVHKYAGRADIICIIDSKNKGKWEKLEGIKYDVPTILDVKTGDVNKVRHFKQLTSYAHAERGIEQVGIIPLNNTTKQGFSKPIVENNKEKYWTLFLDDRAKFKKRFGV